MLAFRPLASNIERHVLFSGARYFSSRAPNENLPLWNRVSNLGIGFLQKRLNLEVVSYKPWTGPKGVINPKAAEMYARAEAAATRRKIDEAMEVQASSK